jgi:quinohemoprotein ethanol dehydrogenase
MQVNRTVCCDMANRGVAVARGKVFVSALDGWMYALDARTGEVVWKTDAVVDRKRGYSSTGRRRWLATSSSSATPARSTTCAAT